MESVVKILREQNRYTQTRLAQILGISRPALINYENMEQDLPLFVVKELSKLFNVSYECLIDNKLPDSETGDDKESLNKICKWYWIRINRKTLAKNSFCVIINRN